jgi:large subunit ribosomal protein L17
MRHLKAGRKLGRNATHRLALYRNLALALFRHERIITTVEKAKAVRPFVEKLITLAKQGTLHARRLALARLGPPSNAEVNPEGDKADDRQKVLAKLFTVIGPRFKDRPGGYTRIVKRAERRLGDGGKTAFLELLKEGETKVRARAPAAPRVEEEKPREERAEQEQPAPESPAPETAAEQPPAPTGETPPESSGQQGTAENPPRA